ncbi:hypothetical protein [Acetobacter tropicalis]|nr:hypothetical protein [Acetobacter tropicalis]
MYTLPSTEDRLKNGIRLSDCYHVLALLDDWIEANFDGMSRAMCECMLCGIPEQAFEFPDRIREFLGPTDLVPEALREFERYRYAISENIKSLLKSGRLTAYGKEKITDEKWQIIPCQYFSLECKISFDENKVIVEGVSFLDVRITCLESLPIWCAMVAYGDQELVPSLMRQVGACRAKMAFKGNIHALFDEIRTFREYFCSLMKEGVLKAVYLETEEQVDQNLWSSGQISLARSEIRVGLKKWRGVKVNTPHPPLNEDDSNILAVNASRVPTGARGYGASDALLAKEMHELILSGKAQNIHRAACLIVDKAKGNSLDTSKVKRLMAVYNKTYPYSD